MDIVDVLERISKKIEAIDPLEERFLRSKGNDNGFEELFPIIVDEVANELSPHNALTFKVHLGHHFPDVDLFFNGLKYGVELKSRNNGSWSTNGNSVLESITGEGYEEIYLFFGSRVPKQKRLLIKYAPYWQTTSNIKVTHSPRFTIDMNKLDSSVFESKEEYDNLREMDEDSKINFLQQYLKENSIGAKWYTAPSEKVSSTSFSDLTPEQKDQIIVEMLILFPDDILIGSRNNKYARSAKYLLETYFVYNPSLRDSFSAGGVYSYQNLDFPKIIGTLASLKELIVYTLNNASNDFFELSKDMWEQNLPTDLISTNMYDSYRNILDYIGTNKTYSSLLQQTNVSKLSDIIL